jgi:hypothetical protein
MSDPEIKTPTALDLFNYTYNPLREIPKPEDLYNIPVEFVRCLVEIGPKVQKSGAWWSLSGDVSENMLDVHVRPTEIEIVTDAGGLEKIFTALSGYNPTPIAAKEWKLERLAEPDGNQYPVFARSNCTELTVKGAKVTVHGDYQMKVGEWEWGDAFYFDPVLINVAGVDIPVMPLRLRTEIYLMLGWVDRAKEISEAYARSHAQLHQLMEGPG